MDYSKLATFDFLFSLGYVTLGASLITMVFTEIIKLILKKTKVLTSNIDSTNGRKTTFIYMNGFQVYSDNDDEVTIIEKKIQARLEAKKNKDWATADAIRNELKSQGIILEDTPQGTNWKRE